MIDKFTIVIPVYNESENLPSFLNNLKNFVNNNKHYKIEVISVNDASTDNSGDILREYNFIKILEHKENKGYGAAIKTGIKNASFDTIIVLDSDGQHNPYEIPKLLSEYDSNNTMVIGKRKITDTNLNRIPGKFILQNLAKYIFNEEIEDINSGFRIFSKQQVLKFLHLCSDRFSFSTSLTLLYIAYGLNIKYVPIEVKIRKSGKSTVNVKSALNMILKIIQIAMIYKPLRVVMPIFITSMVLGLFSFIIDLCHSNLSDSTILFFCMSAIFLVFAFISEQIKTVRIEILEKLKDLNEKK